MPTTVRIADDVNERYKQLAASRGVKGWSVTKEIDDVLRRAAGIAKDPQPGPSARRSAPPSAPAAARPAAAAPTVRRKPPSGAAPVRRPPVVATNPRDCPHPPGRRIGKVCMECGGEVA